MKSALITAAWMTFWTALALSMSGCAVEEVTTTETSKSGLVTTTTRKSSKPVEGVLPFAGELLKAYSPRRIEDSPKARIVREEKSGWVKPQEIERWYQDDAANESITPAEIGNRWKQ